MKEIKTKKKEAKTTDRIEFHKRKGKKKKKKKKNRKSTFQSI